MHRVRIAEREDDVLALDLGAVSHADDVEFLFESFGDALHGVGHERPRQAMQRALRFVLPRGDQVPVLLLKFDSPRHGNVHLALRPLDFDRVRGNLHLYAGGKGDRFSSYSRHGFTKPRTKVRRPRLLCGRSARS